MRKRKSRKGWIGRGLYGIVLIGGLAGILLAVAQGVTVTLRPGVRGRPPPLFGRDAYFACNVAGSEKSPHGKRTSGVFLTAEKRLDMVVCKRPHRSRTCQALFGSSAHTLRPPHLAAG